MNRTDRSAPTDTGTAHGPRCWLHPMNRGDFYVMDSSDPLRRPIGYCEDMIAARNTIHAAERCTFSLRA